MSNQKNSNPISADSIWKNPFLYYLLCPIIAFIIFSGTISHDQALDDDLYINKNPAVQKGINGIKTAWTDEVYHWLNLPDNNQFFRPLLITSFCLEYEFFKSNPTAGHIVNILLYTISCFLVALFLITFFKKMQLPVWLAGIIAMLYAVHPVHTEVVSNIKSRDEIFALLFGVWSFYLFIKHLEHKTIKSLVAVLLAFLFSLFGKESAITFLAVFPMLYWLTSTKPTIVNTLKSIAPLIILSILFLAYRHSIMSGTKSGLPLELTDNTLLGANSISERLGTAFKILIMYIKLMFAPYPLSWDYSLQQISYSKLSSPLSVLSIIVHIGGLAYGIFSVYKRQSIIGFGILFYLATMSITSNLFITIASTMAERFLLIPSLGFIIALVVLIYKYLPQQKIAQQLSIAVFILIGVTFSYLTFTQSLHWKNNYTLFTHGVTIATNSTRTQGGAATQYLAKAKEQSNPSEKQQYIDLSIQHATKALEIYDKNLNARIVLGNNYFELGDLEKAKEAYIKALSYYPNNSNALGNLTAVAWKYFREKKNGVEAGKLADIVLNSNPDHRQALEVKAATHFSQGQLQEAVQYLETILLLEPNNKFILEKLVFAYSKLGDAIKATQYQQALNKLK